MTGELRPVLECYRRRVEKAWSAGTSHPEYNGAAGSPVGQCGVTSAWLQERLLEDHGIKSLYCEGRVTCTAHSRTLRRHCWLEVGDMTWDRTVIDLTADQISCWDETYLYASYWVLCEEFARYSADVRLPHPSRDDDLMPRLSLLKKAVS